MFSGNMPPPMTPMWFTRPMEMNTGFCMPWGVRVGNIGFGVVVGVPTVLIGGTLLLVFTGLGRLGAYWGKLGTILLTILTLFNVFLICKVPPETDEDEDDDCCEDEDVEDACDAPDSEVVGD